jgi:alpha-L-fucosidase
MLEVNFAKPVTFDHALIMERLTNGQHIQSFRIEVWDGAAWKSVAADHSVGHKRIESFPAQTAARVRLNILSSTDAAEISEFQLFLIGDR